MSSPGNIDYIINAMTVRMITWRARPPISLIPATQGNMLDKGESKMEKSPAGKALTMLRKPLRLRLSPNTLSLMTRTQRELRLK